jgi:hypothetical protein
MSRDVGEALFNTLVSPNERDSHGEPANVVDGLFAIARSLDDVALQLRNLGNAGAITAHGTELGAIEGLAMKIEEGLGHIASAIDNQA